MLTQLYPGVRVEVISLLPGMPTRQRVTVQIENCNGCKALEVRQKLKEIHGYVPQQECRVSRNEKCYSFRFEMETYGEFRTELAVHRTLAA